MTNPIKKIIAKEGLILLGVILCSGVFLFIAKGILDDEYTIFNYECSIQGIVQKIDIVEMYRPRHELESALYGSFIQKNTQLFSKEDIELAKHGKIPWYKCLSDFVVKRLPNEYSPNGLTKRIFLNMGLVVIFLYFIYVFCRVYNLLKNLMKSGSKQSKNYILFNEAIVILKAAGITLALNTIGFLAYLIFANPTTPTQDSVFISFFWDIWLLYACCIVYAILQLKRFIIWAIKTLKAK